MSSSPKMTHSQSNQNSKEERQFTFKIIKRRSPWTESEDNAIISLVQKHGTGNWTIISNEMSTKYNFKNRSGKQCRERWHNHLDPKVNKNYWDEAEETILFEKHMELGNKWSDIAKFLPGRTDNSIKNHFYSKLRKYIRRILKQINKENLMKNYNIDFNKYNSDRIYKLLKRSKVSYKNLNKETILAIITNNEKNSTIGNQSAPSGNRLRLRKYTNYKVGKKKSNETFYNGNNKEGKGSLNRKRSRKRKVSISISTPEKKKRQSINNTYDITESDNNNSDSLSNSYQSSDEESNDNVEYIRNGLGIQDNNNIIINKKLLSNQIYPFDTSNIVFKPIPLINSNLLQPKPEITIPFQEQTSYEDNKVFSYIQPQISPIDINSLIAYPPSTRNSFNIDFKGGYLIHTPKVVIAPSVVINSSDSQTPSAKEKKPQIDISLINNANDNKINLSPISAFIPKKIE